MPTIYYKATRPNGTDFYTGTVDYAAALASGEPVRITKRGPRQCCTNTVLHASTVPAETLIGGSWPCRLFTVTGRPVDEDVHKRGFVTLRVVEELPAWQALGPNGQQVAALIDRIRRMTPDEMATLSDGPAFRNKEERLATTVAGKSAARVHAVVATMDAITLLMPNPPYEAINAKAMDASWDGARALVVADLLHPATYRTLTGPLASVIGPEWFSLA